MQRKLFLQCALLAPLAFSAYANTATNSNIAVQRGGTLIANIQPEPPGLVASIIITSPAIPVSANIFDGLVRYDESGRPLPQLAQSWDVSADQKTITFNLRKDVLWHDGKPFTSADVQYTVMEVLKKTHPRGPATLSRVVAVDTPDAHTAVFRLSAPSPIIWSVLDGAESTILPRHLYAGTEPGSNPWNTKPIGTGPFVFKEWVRGSHILLERNPNYWDKGKPYLDKLIFKIIPDATARAAALESGEVLLAYNTPVAESDVPRLSKNKNLVIDTSAYDSSAPMYFFDFNMRRAPFQDIRVRRAFAHAIDRQALAKVVWHGLATPATSPVPSVVKAFHQPGLPQYEYDVDKANKLLDEAGLKRDKNGIRLRITHTPAAYGQAYQRAAELMKQQLRKVGVEMTLQTYDLPTYVRKTFGEYDFDTHSAWYSSFPDPAIGVTRRFWSKNIKPGTASSNASGYSDPQMDALIEAINAETDANARKQRIVEMQKRAQEEIPSINLLEQKFFLVHSRKVQGLRPGPYRSSQSLADAWIAP